MGEKKNEKKAKDYRGQLMLQISACRYFQPDADIEETVHRRTMYSNAWMWQTDEIDLPPIGKLIPSTANDDVFGHILEAIDRLERPREDDENATMALLATGGDDLVDDLAYVLTFAMNRTFSRDLEKMRKLVPQYGATGSQRKAAGLFPQLFEPRTALSTDDFDKARGLLQKLLELSRDDFARVMRVIRSAVDATRSALDDPTGAYTDLVAALESLADDDITTPTTWDRYDGRKAKIIDKAIEAAPVHLADKLREAVLEADRVGLKRRFVSATLARISPDYYRREATYAVLPPSSADVERMLGIAYDIRSRKSHVLQDLGEETWGFSDGAEVAYEPRLARIYTLAGLWRLTRHVVNQYIESAPKVSPEPWDFQMSLPGIRFFKWAPEYWIWQDLPAKHKPAEAYERFEAFTEALISWHVGRLDNFTIGDVATQIEQIVPTMPDGDHKTTLIGLHRLWHEWTDPDVHTLEGKAFALKHESRLNEPSPIAFAVRVLSRFATREWTAQEHADLAIARRAARVGGKGIRLPAKLDALIQLEAAAAMEEAGRHAEALMFAGNAVEECPGNALLLEWEERLAAGSYQSDFDAKMFLLEPKPDDQADGEEGSANSDRDAGTDPVAEDADRPEA